MKHQDKSSQIPDYTSLSGHHKAEEQIWQMHAKCVPQSTAVLETAALIFTADVHPVMALVPGVT